MSKELSIQNNFLPSGLSLELQGFINFDKSQIKYAAKTCETAVMDGAVDAIDALIFTKKLSELAKELDAKIRPIAEGKPIDKDYSKFGVKIIEGMQGVKYDFDHCEDPVYNGLLANFEVAKAELDARKDLLKTVTKDTEMYDPETSEVFVCKPPVKSGKLGFTLTIR